MQDGPERDIQTVAQRFKRRETIEVAVGIALIAAIFLLAILVGSAP